MQLKRYSSKEPLILLWIVLPYVFIVTLIFFGGCLFESFKKFIFPFGTSLIFFILIYILYGRVAILIKNRFPDDASLFKRILTMLPVFYTMNLVVFHGLPVVYEWVGMITCPLHSKNIWWAIGFGCLGSTIITIFNEAAAGWEKWKTSVTETFRLQNAYQRSRLLGLKRQINPHFLFNCFNSLSSLIQESEEDAEDFLNEMTKVYRYLLKSDDEHLVSLEEELKFTRSYVYLNKIRFGDAFLYDEKIDNRRYSDQIAPLSLQVILENAIYRNAISKSKPLHVIVETNQTDNLVIRHNLNIKTGVSGDVDYEEAMDNLVKKYTMLSETEVVVEENKESRSIIIPLIKQREVVI